MGFIYKRPRWLICAIAQPFTLKIKCNTWRESLVSNKLIQVSEAIRTEQEASNPATMSARQGQVRHTIHTPTSGNSQNPFQKSAPSSNSPTRKVLYPNAMEQMQIELDPFGNAPPPHQVWA